MTEPKLSTLLADLKSEEFTIISNQVNEQFVHNLLYFLKSKNIDVLYSEITKNNDSQTDKIIFKNLLKLMPLSNPIVEKVIDKNYYGEDVIDWIDNIWLTASNIQEIIKSQKLKIRNNLTKVIESQKTEIEKECENTKKEIKKSENEKKELEQELKNKKKLIQEKKQIDASIKKIKDELDVSNIDELRVKLEDYKKIDSEIATIKEEIKSNKKIYSTFPKDDDEDNK